MLSNNPANRAARYWAPKEAGRGFSDSEKQFLPGKPPVRGSARRWTNNGLSGRTRGGRRGPPQTFSKVYLTYPSLRRVGLFPLVAVLGCAALVFYLSFQAFFMDLAYSMTPQLYLEQGILDVMVLLTLPCSLLYTFVIFQVRVRLGKQGQNWMSLLHLFFCLVSVVISILYIIARPREAFGFMLSLMPDQSGGFEKLIVFVENLRSTTSAFYLAFNDPKNALFPAAMYVTSYAFICQFMVAALLTTFASAQYGQKEVFVVLMSNGEAKEQVIAQALTVTRAERRALYKYVKKNKAPKK